MTRIAATLISLAIIQPAFAQEAIDPAGAAAVRTQMQHHHGGGVITYVEGERFEFQVNDDEELFVWDAQGYYGGDINKFWVKTEGEIKLGESGFEEAEIQALYSRAVGSFWDVQAGVRQDFGKGEELTYAVIGVQGLAPYLFEVDAAAFLSDEGDVSARIEVEYELLLTQRLILQPRVELNLSAQDDVERMIGAGLSSVETGLRLRYEVRREFAPYVGVSWRRFVGDTADYARLSGKGPSEASFVGGVRFWF